MEKNPKRTEFINKAIYDFRGGMAREFYFTNEDIPYIPYYYDPSDDCLHSDAVSVPFHYKEEDINNGVIYNALEELQIKLMNYYRVEKGINLYEYD